MSMDYGADRWFVEEILPHEGALMRYLKRVSRVPSDVPDLRQETYIRVYESAVKARPRSPKYFLLTTARNLIADKIRRGRVVSIDYPHDLAWLELSIDELTPERRLSAHQELQQLTSAFDRLPETTRAVIWLRRVLGLSQREAARSLGIEEGALEGHMTRGLRSLAEAVLSDSTNKKQPEHVPWAGESTRQGA